MLVLPIPDVPAFVAGVLSCAAAVAAVIAIRRAVPAIKSLFTKTTGTIAADTEKAINFLDSKLNALANGAASAVNAVRGDVDGLKARVAALETAVGVPAPVEAPAAPAVTGAIVQATAPLSVAK